MSRSEIIISTGGLGPTEDDITKKVFARVLQRRMVLNDAVLAKIQARFAKRDMKMPEINSRQALIPDRATALENNNGTAPGILMTEGKCVFVLLPGPPREMKPMFTEQVMPKLRERAGDIVLLRRQLSIFGLTESGVDERAAPIYKNYKNPTTTILFGKGQIELHLTAQAKTEAEANKLLDELSGKLEMVLGDNVFSLRNQELEEVVGELLSFKQYTLATAESCTGGLLAGRITEVPGSSAYFKEGVISYANEAKVDLLGVPNRLLEKHGAVSPEVAEAMAIGIRRRARTTIGLGITGIAGPGGGSDEKPVGLVYIGLADEVQSSSRKFLFPGDRQFIRTLAVNAALDMIRRRIK
jgi:nicotinamide-nucleotide amidase